MKWGVVLSSLDQELWGMCPCCTHTKRQVQVLQTKGDWESSFSILESNFRDSWKCMGGQDCTIYIQPQSSPKYVIGKTVSVCALFSPAVCHFWRLQGHESPGMPAMLLPWGNCKSPLWAPCPVQVTELQEGGGMGKVLERSVVEKKEWFTKRVIWRFLCLRKFSANGIGWWLPDKQ